MNSEVTGALGKTHVDLTCHGVQPLTLQRHTLEFRGPGAVQCAEGSFWRWVDRGSETGLRSDANTGTGIQTDDSLSFVPTELL